MLVLRDYLAYEFETVGDSNRAKKVGEERATKILPDVRVDVASKAALKLGTIDLDSRIKRKTKGFGILPPRRKIDTKKKIPSSSSRAFTGPATGSTRGYCGVSNSFHHLNYNTQPGLNSSNRVQRFTIPPGAQRSVRTRAVATAFVAAAAFLSFDGANAEHTAPNLHTAIPRTHPHKPSTQSNTNSIFTFRGGGDLFSPQTDERHSPNTSTPPQTPPLEFSHGTTTLSFLFSNGIVAAVDSRASIGNFVGSKTTQKVLPINRHIVGTMAGGAADCSFWIRRLQAEARLHELTEGKGMTVARASRILADCLYANKGLDLSVGTMIMGFDDECGPSIYYVDNTGMRTRGELFAVGSGSTFALGVLDTERREDMDEGEAVALGIKAIRHATFRDAYSGGYIAVYVITSEGWRKVFSEDLALTAEERVRKVEMEVEVDGVE